MTVRRGITLLEMLPLPAGAEALVPEAVASQLGLLCVLGHRSMTTEQAFVHTGMAQAMLDALQVNTTNWGVRAPGLTSGLRFQLAVARAAPLAGELEAVGQRWQLDLFLSPVEVLLPFRAAREVTNAEGLTVLEADPGQQAVWLLGAAILRVAHDGTGGVSVELIDSPDPFDLDRPTGAVLDLTLRPPTFVFGSSQFGMTLDRFEFDFSESYTPPDVVARGQDEAWQGVAFREATFYAPPSTPVVGALSIGLRDVIVGSPFGMQGELAIQLGRDSTGGSLAQLRVMREVDGHADEVTPAPSGAGDFAIPVDATTHTASIYVEFTLSGTGDEVQRGVWWKLPDGQQGTALRTPTFTVPHPGNADTPFRYRVRIGAEGTPDPAHPDGVPEGQVELGEIRIVFRARGTSSTPAGDPTTVSKVTVRSGSLTYHNVTSVAGTHDQLAGLMFTASKTDGTPDASARWELPPAPAASGATPSLTIPTAPGSYWLKLTCTSGSRHVSVEVRADGDLFVGHGSDSSGRGDVATPLIDADAAAARYHVALPVGSTFDLAAFHAAHDLQPASVQATLVGTGPLVVPDGTIAEVVVTWSDTGVGAGPGGLPASTDSPAAVPLTAFSVDGYNSNSPNPADTTALRAWVAAWVAATPSGATPPAFYVVGRTDDLWQTSRQDQNNEHNADLAERRAAGIADIIHAEAPSATVSRRGEHEAASSGAPAEASVVGRLVPPNLQSPTGARYWYNGGRAPDNQDLVHHIHLEAHDDVRAHDRRVDIFVVAPTTTPGSGGTTPGPPGTGPRPGSLRLLVPGDDTATPPARRRTGDQSSPSRPWMVRLRARWDSPVIATPGDVIPTECEVTVSWTSSTTNLPRGAGTLPPPTGPSGPQVWTFVGRWTYDARSGQTAFLLSLTLPDGAATVDSDPLAGALALAPALTGLLPPSDIAGGMVSFVGIMLVGGAIGALINQDRHDPAPPYHASKVHFQRFELDYTGRADHRVRFVCDYTVDLNVNFDAGVGALVGDGMKLKYKNVGVEVDFTDSTFEGVRLTYDALSVEVENPGNWTLTGAIGDLLRITSTHMGHGSTWIEFTLGFAIDLGVISLDGAVIRIIMNGPSVAFELRGLTIGVDVPGTLTGRGSLALSDGGALRGMISVTIVPTKLSAYASLAIDPPMVALEMGVQLPVGIPLASTGLALYGFLGRFVANGTRTLGSGSDPVQRELDWYCAPPQDKYQKLSGQFALGVGAIIGTMPDGGTTFNAEGMICVAFPDVSVVFGIDAQLLSPRKSAAAERGDETTSGSHSTRAFRIIGVTVIDKQSLIIGVRGSFKIDHVLELTIPISGYFPFPGTAGDCYLRIGSDGVTDVAGHERPGDPVQIRLLPDSLDVRAWAFFMIEQNQLHHLGHDPTLNFDGFSIGFGAGFNLDWGSSAIGIHAGASLLVGFGTRPLTFAGAIEVHGSLALIIISISFEGDIHFTIADTSGGLVWHLHAHFCGSISFFFFSISACIDIDFGGGDPGLEPPPSPLTGIDLTDHLGAIKGRALAAGSTDPVPTVWPDTVPVLQFTHYVADDVPAGAAFVRRIAEPAGPAWSGTSELKYAYRLTNVELYEITGGGAVLQTGPYDSAWWLPTHRPGVALPETPASPEEARQLGLLWWNPAPWARWLGDGAESLPGDPARTWSHTCDDAQPPPRACALGQVAVAFDERTVRFWPPAAVSAASFFVVAGGPPAGIDPGLIEAVLGGVGALYVPGGARPLIHPVTIDEAGPLNGACALDEVRRETALVGTAPFEGQLVPALADAVLTLLVCPQTLAQLERCDRFGDLQSQAPSPLVHGEITYTAMEQPAFQVSPDHTLLFGRGMHASWSAATSRVRVTVVGDGSKLTAVAFDAAGRALVSNFGSPPSGSQATIDLAAAGIVAVDITGGGGKGGLVALCRALPSAALLGDSFGPAAAATEAAFPAVRGITADGKVIAWKAKVIRAVDEGGQKPCQIVRYDAPNTASPWVRFTIASCTQGSVSILSLCGVTFDARAAAQQDQRVRNSLRAAWTYAAGFAPGESSRPHLLEANASYELRVTWEWQGWRHLDSSPAPVLGAWTPGATDVYRFHTAAEGTSTPASPGSGAAHFIDDPTQAGAVYDESVFDPRGIARYLIGFSPAQTDPPHYLADDVLARFSADHMQTLLDVYHRTLRVKVRRTDPLPGATPGKGPGLVELPILIDVPAKPHPLDVPTTLEWAPLPSEHAYPCDARVLDDPPPCVPGRAAFGGTQARVIAPLIAGASYDLLLVAPPSDDLELDHVLIARTHFSTSRYRDPAEQLAALGFTVGGSAVAPRDAIVTAAAPDASLGSDASLAATLSAMGLVSEPVPPGPRTTALWLAPVGGGPWRLAGVLLDSDEPLLRDGRLALSGATLTEGSGAVVGTLSLWAANRAATRVLFAGAPLGVPPGAPCTIAVGFGHPDDAPAQASRLIFDRPLAILQEGL